MENTGRSKGEVGKIAPNLLNRDFHAEKPNQNLQEFQSMDHFKQELVEYLDYYNNHRIKAKLKGLPPARHRQQALSAA